jgi:hypothetical protein
MTKKTTLGGAPIQRKKKVIREAGPAYNPKEHVKGVQHYVEGRSNLKYKEVTAQPMRIAGESRKNAMDDGRYTYRINKEGKKAKQYNKGIDKQIAQFGLIDEARAKLRTIVDPQETALNERKRAARRRMRGRLGTMLSGQGETLG